MLYNFCRGTSFLEKTRSVMNYINDTELEVVKRKERKLGKEFYP